VTLEELAATIGQLGCPKEKSLEMARQLERRARQLAEERDCSHNQALVHLLGLMKQGWAAKEEGF
jgi:hypothetical protein